MFFSIVSVGELFDFFHFVPLLSAEIPATGLGGSPRESRFAASRFSRCFFARSSGFGRRDGLVAYSTQIHVE